MNHNYPIGTVLPNGTEADFRKLYNCSNLLYVMCMYRRCVGEIVTCRFCNDSYYLVWYGGGQNCIAVPKHLVEILHET